MRDLAVERVGAHGPRIALVHGFTQTARSWARIGAALCSDFEVFAVDAPGHGGSAGVEADLVDGASLLVDACGPATYVGYSMGGRLALHAALAHPDAVERLVLLGATPGIEDAGERYERRAADEALARDLERDGIDEFLARWLAQPIFANLDTAAAGLADRRRNTVAGLASSLHLTGTGAQQNLWPRLCDLKMPVLALAGEHDAKFRAIAVRMAREIGAGAEVAVVPYAGHAAHLERPDAFVALLREWLAAHPPSASPTPNARP